jgi:alpha-glucosidase
MRLLFHKSYHASLLFFLGVSGYVSAVYVDPTVLDACPGYVATNVKVRRDGLTADLVLRGKPCDVFGSDIQNLSLSVVYETGMETFSFKGFNYYY